jgi:hypothetical protein
MVTVCPERSAPWPSPTPSATDEGAQRPVWWREVALIAFGYFLYTITRNAAPPHVLMAHHHASAVLTVERWLHINVELMLNRLLSGHHLLGAIASYYYATLHFAVTLGVLVWLYHRHPQGYRQARTLLIGATLVGLFLFWAYPLAPPRLTGLGYTDTIGTVRLWGGTTWNSPGLASVSNEYAAMPSLHVAWALWSAIMLSRFSRHRSVQLIAPIYPVVTLLVVLSTANHFVLDAVGAVAVLWVVAIGQRLAVRYDLATRVATAARRRNQRIPGDLGASDRLGTERGV